MDHSFADLLTHSVGVYDSVKNGNYVDAWAHTLPIQEFAIEQARGAGFKGEPPGAEPDDAEEGDAEKQKEILHNLKAAKSAIGKAPAKGAKAPKGKGAKAPKGALGDGKILRKLLEVLLAILPVIFKE